MTQFWQRLSQTTRTFIAFSLLIVPAIVATVVFQTGYFTNTRMTHLSELEIPVHLEKMALGVRLQLEASLQVSRSLANDSALQNRLLESSADERRQLLQTRLASVQEGIAVNTLFLLTNLPDDSRYYQFSLGQLKDRPLSRNNPEDAWYYEFIASDQQHVLNLGSNTLSGNQDMMFVNYRSKQTNAHNLPLLVGGVALEMSALNELISGYRLGEHGYVSLVNTDGSIQSAPDDAVLPHLQQTEVYQQLINNHDGQVFEYRHNRQDYLLSSIWLKNLKRWLVLEVPNSEITAPIRKQMWVSLAVGLSIMLGSLLLVYPIANSLSRPLRKLHAQLGNITNNLDLSQRLQIGDKAELGDLATQVNRLLERLQRTMQEILRASNYLNDSANRLAYTAGLSQDSHDLQQQVSHSMAAAIEQMSSSVAEITSTMEELSASSTQIADHSQAVVDVANQTLDSSRKGASAMQELEQHMTAIHNDYTNSLQDILELGNQSKEISKVMDLINNVADQTKLIAFNAALEASSAGEAGKRFSVVASEIRRLADSVTGSTHSIEERIQAIQSSISRLVLTSEKAVNSVQSGMQVSSSTADELNELVHAATRTSNAAQQISLSTRQQKTASSQVVIALHDIANASATNAESVRHITQISEELLKMAHALNALMVDLQVSHQPPETPEDE